MNWPAVIEKNRDALLRIVAALFDIAGDDSTLPRATRNYLLRILRPAESAARRLIVIAARGIEVEVKFLPASPLRGGRRSKAAAKRTARLIRVGVRTAEAGRFSPPPGSVTLRVPVADLPSRGRSKPKRSKTGIAYPPGYRPEDETPTATPASTSFPLLDPLKRFDFAPRRRYATTVPRVRALANISLPVYMRTPEPPAPHAPTPDDQLDATHVLRRLAALKRALDDIDSQAKRLARWQARRDFRRQQPNSRPGRIDPMRPGWPPGRRKRPRYEIDDILRECHSLAVMKPPDTG